MAKKEKKTYVMTEKSLEYLNSFMDKTGLNRSQAINRILTEHEKSSNLTTEYLIEQMTKQISENIKVNLRIMTHAINSTDKNSQIILELLNGEFIKNNIGNIFSIDENKSPALQKAEKVVIEKIQTKRISKLDKEY